MYIRLAADEKRKKEMEQSHIIIGHLQDHLLASLLVPSDQQRWCDAQRLEKGSNPARVATSIFD